MKSLTLERGDRLKTSIKIVNPRTVRVKIVITAVDPYYRYSNKSGSAN